MDERLESPPDEAENRKFGTRLPSRQRTRETELDILKSSVTEPEFSPFVNKEWRPNAEGGWKLGRRSSSPSFPSFLHFIELPLTWGNFRVIA